MKNAFKCFISFIGFFTMAIAAQAQGCDGQIHISAGPEINHIGLKAPYTDLHGFGPGFYADAYYEDDLCDDFDYSIGISMLTVGAMLKYPNDYKLDLNTFYAQLPVLVWYHAVHHYYFGCGPYLGYGLGGRYKSDAGKDKAFTGDAGIYQLNHLCLGLQLAAQYRLNTMLGLSLAYSYGITNMAKDKDVKIHRSEIAIGVDVNIGNLFEEKEKPKIPEDKKIVDVGEKIVEKKDTLKPCTCSDISFVMAKNNEHMDAKVRAKVVKGEKSSHFSVTFDATAMLACTRGNTDSCWGAVYITGKAGVMAESSREFQLKAGCGGSKKTSVSWTVQTVSVGNAEFDKKEYTVTYTIEAFCGGHMKRQVYTADLSGSLGLHTPHWGPWTDVPDEEAKKIKADFDKKTGH